LSNSNLSRYLLNDPRININAGKRGHTSMPRVGFEPTIQCSRIRRQN
jgi:hypothetical protein